MLVDLIRIEMLEKRIITLEESNGDEKLIGMLRRLKLRAENRILEEVRR